MSTSSSNARPSDSQAPTGSAAVLGIAAAITAAGVALWLLPAGEGELSDAGRATAAIGTLMAVLWMTQAVPLPVTSLLPLILFPLAGVMPIKAAAAPYAHPLIFLFLGGFLIALAIQRWNLHRRIALLTVLTVGTQPNRLVGGFMLATAFLSMWISNTATTVMMLPIGVSVLALLSDHDSTTTGDDRRARQVAVFGTSLLLAIAYGANLGGLATLVGTPPNLVLAGFVKDTYDIELGFGRWMAFALPVSLLSLAITWLLMTRVLFRTGDLTISAGRKIIRGELHRLGPMSRGERLVLIVFALTAFCWIFREPLTGWTWLSARLPFMEHVDDTIIALTGALLLFVLPVNLRRGEFVMNWEATKELPWGVLILFGGGLSLAAAVKTSGLGDWIGQQVGHLDWLPLLGLVIAATTAVIFLTELTSNTATATTFLPILGGVAVGIGLEPLLLLAPAALAASCAFMMPVATPPNAIVFASGRIPLRSMIAAGLWLNLIEALLIPLLMYWLGSWVFDLPLAPTSVGL